MPPVFPVVLYNGARRWSAEQDIYDMVKPPPPEFLRPYRPHLRYYLIDEGRYTDEELGLRQTPLSGVFSIERASKDRRSL
ncbi:Rpn family recombination-promoting nuclease/putative transposase [Halomonas sp. PR-M31]|uniref:Rpn family recombination-promoting nuclease/putative transposase n=1 Tax=Halomonas sp. PR-M31 TaxID=1471202 RepID=UPI000651377A|nr:Rpn family recombination-promoting nuclease/putative transposase [Halomonas sp. PR-M31]